MKTIFPLHQCEGQERQLNVNRAMQASAVNKWHQRGVKDWGLQVPEHHHSVHRLGLHLEGEACGYEPG